jgi:hypothetical protein
VVLPDKRQLSCAGTIWVAQTPEEVATRVRQIPTRFVSASSLGSSIERSCGGIKFSAHVKRRVSIQSARALCLIAIVGFQSLAQQ